MWNWWVWLISAGIFYFLWLAFYTSMFGALTRPYVECPDTLPGAVDVACTRLGGAFTGVWQSLGYWIAQHDVTRGNQPWFYYMLTMSVYEFLPLILGLIGVGYYLLRGGFLGLALGLWALLSFVLYSIAGEKMPWLTANLAVPFAMLAGKFAGDLLEGMPWRRLAANKSIILAVAAPALAASAMYLLLRFLAADDFNDWRGWTAVAVTAALVIVVGNLIRLAKPRAGFALSLLSIGVLLLGFTAYTAGRAAYTRDDYPVELLVYAGASEDIRVLSEELREHMAQQPPEQRALVDYEVWYPFAWYVRKDRNIEFRCFKEPDEAGYVSWCSKISEPPGSPALALLDSHGRRDSLHLTAYVQTGPHRDLLWFPEVYRRPNEDRKGERFWEELPKDIAFARDRVQDKESWRGGLEYFIYRKLSSEWWDTRFFTYLSRP
jgi:predicted membrane-bound mannosyltransferase